MGKHSACNFWHPSRDVAVTVHGDDFTATGRENELQWFNGILKGAYEVKTKFLGPDKQRHLQEVRILNRVIRWEEWGIGYEADQRHAELVVKELGLEESRPVTTPGAKEDVNRANNENGFDISLDEN